MTFTGWMGLQRGRNDPVGDLARRAAADEGFPSGHMGGYRAWEGHLESKAAVPAMLQALKKAWDEYGGRE